MRHSSRSGTVTLVNNNPIGVTEAARRLGMTRRGVHKAIHRGDLHALKLPGPTGAYVLDPTEVERFATSRIST